MTFGLLSETSPMLQPTDAKAQAPPELSDHGTNIEQNPAILDLYVFSTDFRWTIVFKQRPLFRIIQADDEVGDEQLQDNLSCCGLLYAYTERVVGLPRWMNTLARLIPNVQWGSIQFASSRRRLRTKPSRRQSKPFEIESRVCIVVTILELSKWKAWPRILISLLSERQEPDSYGIRKTRKKLKAIKIFGPNVYRFVSDNSRQFTAKENVRTIGLHFNRARYYSPTL